MTIFEPVARHDGCGRSANGVAAGWGSLGRYEVTLGQGHRIWCNCKDEKGEARVEKEMFGLNEQNRTMIEKLKHEICLDVRAPRFENPRELLSPPSEIFRSVSSFSSRSPRSMGIVSTKRCLALGSMRGEADLDSCFQRGTRQLDSTRDLMIDLFQTPSDHFGRGRTNHQGSPSARARAV